MLYSTRNLALALITTLIVRPCFAASDTCFSPLVFLSDSVEAPVSRIAGTYADLLDKVGVKLTPETMAKMKDSGDPFDVPAQEGADLSVLKKNLAELKRMLESKVWLDTIVVSSLLEQIERRRLGVTTAAQKQAAATRATFKFTVPLDEGNHYSLASRDGKWLINVTQKLGLQDPLVGRVVNLETGAVTPFRTPVAIEDAFFGPMSFSTTGNEVLLMMQMERFLSVPFREGVLDWGKSESKGKEAASRTNAGPDSDGRYAFGHESAAKGEIYRYDLSNFKRQSIVIPGIGSFGGKLHPTVGLVGATTVSLEGYGQVPHSDRIWVYKREAAPDPALLGTFITRDYVETYELKRKGLWSSTFTAVKPVVLVSKPYEGHLHLSWTETGELLTRDRSKIDKWTSPDKPVAIFNGFVQKPSLKPEASPKSQMILNGVFVELLVEPFGGPARWVRTVDLTTGRILAETAAPSGVDSVQITPDGTKLIFGSRTSIHILPHDPAP